MSKGKEGLVFFWSGRRSKREVGKIESQEEGRLEVVGNSAKRRLAKEAGREKSEGGR